MEEDKRITEIRRELKELTDKIESSHPQNFLAEIERTEYVVRCLALVFEMEELQNPIPKLASGQN